MIAAITVTRGCCSVREDNFVCPPGSEQQTVTSDNPPFTVYLVSMQMVSNFNPQIGCWIFDAARGKFLTTWFAPRVEI
jgi:hypothetical protein